ncbi:collagen-binding protein [Bacteroidia bacterium]|nr:collagen-binding protein [Bacteroidia bacterium]
MIAQNQTGSGEQPSRYTKTSVDLVINQQYLKNQLGFWAAANAFIYKNGIKPYEPWLNYAQLIKENSQDLDLTIFLYEDYKAENQKMKSSGNSLFSFIGTENIAYFLDEWLGETDIYKDKNEVLFLPIQSPLNKSALNTYKYFLSSTTEIEGVSVYEIVFFSNNPKAKAFEGYLYVSMNDLRVVKAVFTLNHSVNPGSVKDILVTQTPEGKEISLYLGDDITRSLMVSRTNVPGKELTAAQKELPGLLAEANQTRAYQNLEKALSLLLTNRIEIAGGKLELGPVSQMISYNRTEGIRLRIGANTSQRLNKHLMLGGYLAYGTHDNQWKYRGDIHYSPQRGEQWQLTYVHDLNIPGYDLMADQRDHFFYALSHSEIGNMTMQEISQLSYEKEFSNGFSIKSGIRYWRDEPVSGIKYRIENQGVETIVKDISSTELNIFLRYAPSERYVRVHNKRVIFRNADIDLKLNHRLGIKGVFGSDYAYQITDANAYKRFNLPSRAGSFGIKLSAGKVWNRLPFPLLFIPAGNQSYVFEKDNYNLMNFYEFITDRFVSGNFNLQFNWSPLKLFLPKNGIRTNLGLKTIYGPLSGNNDPHLHPELFVFNNGFDILGNRPYAEAHIGLSHILNFLRVDYVRHLTYGNRGSVFISTNFSL